MEKHTLSEKLKMRPLLVICLYFAAYLVTFFLLEKIPRSQFHIIHCTLDDHIPFVAIAVVPYVLWFLWVPFHVMRFLVRSREEFWRLFCTIMAGTAVSLAIFAIFPTALHLRQPLLGTDPFTWLVGIIRQADTATNVCPSLHVFVSVEIWLAILDSNWTSRRAKWHNGIICFLICLSTILIDQHSCIDLLCGVIMALIFHCIFNRRTLLWPLLDRSAHQRRRRVQDLR